MAERVHSIAIIGGGAAGWLAAATLARVLKPGCYSIRLIDMPRGTAGAHAEVALPSFHRLNGLLGIDESDLLRRTAGTFRLGAQFSDWGGVGERYFHTSGAIGAKLDAVPFHHYWIKLRQLGEGASIEDYSMATVAAKHGRFAPPSLERTSFLSSYSYGYHFHAGLLAAYLREYSLEHGVTHIERNVLAVRLRGEDGFVDALQLDDGSRVRADLYIDCTGRACLQNGYEDWSRWFPCDRAVGVLCASSSEPAPYSQASAGRFGWHWRIPLQHCVDSGQVYSSRFVSDDEATALMLAGLPGTMLGEPRLLQWTAGRLEKFWDKNCITLPGSRLEPLESTGLHLVQTGIARLLTLFPVRQCSPEDQEEYNRLTGLEHERIRDFLILHYKASTRVDSPFWEHCRQMELPAGLQTRIELFRQCARIALLDEEHFTEESWLTVLVGQGLYPQDYDPLADVLDIEQVRDALSRMRSMIRSGVQTMPSLARFIAEYCRARADHVGARS